MYNNPWSCSLKDIQSAGESSQIENTMVAMNYEMYNKIYIYTVHSQCLELRSIEFAYLV